MARGNLRLWRFFKGAQQYLRISLGLPRPAVYRLVRSLAVWTAPLESARRRRIAVRLAGAVPLLRSVPRAEGYLHFAAGELPGSEGAVAFCRQLFERLQREEAAPALRQGYKKQEFLVPLLRGEALGAHRELLEFLVSPAIAQATAGYFGSLPVLAKLSLLWSPVNASAESSQLFHHDLEDTTQLKLFLHILDVDAVSGPFTLIPAGASRRITRQIGYDGGRIDDAAVVAAGEAGSITEITGESGGGVFVDTSRCLHFGSRGNRRERLLLMAQFVRFGAPNCKPTRWAGAVATAGIALDPTQRLLLLA